MLARFACPSWVVWHDRSAFTAMVIPPPLLDNAARDLSRSWYTKHNKNAQIEVLSF
jgi:hypothetical protein